VFVGKQECVVRANYKAKCCRQVNSFQLLCVITHPDKILLSLLTITFNLCNVCATYVLDDRGSILGGGEEGVSLFDTASRAVLVRAQFPLQWVPVFSCG